MAALAASYKSNLSAPVVAPKTVAPPSSKYHSLQAIRFLTDGPRYLRFCFDYIKFWIKITLHFYRQYELTILGFAKYFRNVILANF